MTKEPGIYIVTLNNEIPISINAQDPRYADIVYKANYKKGESRQSQIIRSKDGGLL